MRTLIFDILEPFFKHPVSLKFSAQISRIPIIFFTQVSRIPITPKRASFLHKLCRLGKVGEGNLKNESYIYQ